MELHLQTNLMCDIFPNETAISTGIKIMMGIIPSEVSRKGMLFHTEQVLTKGYRHTNIFFKIKVFVIQNNKSVLINVVDLYLKTRHARSPAQVFQLANTCRSQMIFYLFIYFSLKFVTSNNVMK